MRIARHDSAGVVELSDGSKWRIWPADMADTLQWLPTTELEIVRSSDGLCSHVLTNMADNSQVRVIAEHETWPAEATRLFLKDNRGRQSLGGQRAVDMHSRIVPPVREWNARSYDQGDTSRPRNRGSPRPCSAWRFGARERDLEWIGRKLRLGRADPAHSEPGWTRSDRSFLTDSLPSRFQQLAGAGSTATSRQLEALCVDSRHSVM
jgi:hypothetical protein